MSGYLTNFSILHCVLLAMAAAECALMLYRRDWSPWALYAIASGVAALGVAKWGAGESYFLGAIASICVLSGAWVGRFLEASPSGRLRWALGLALFIQGLLLSHAEVSDWFRGCPTGGRKRPFWGTCPPRKTCTRAS